MQKALIVLFSLALLTSLVYGVQTPKKEPYNVQVKELYSAPAEDANLVYSIPIEVKLLDVSADANWYKVKIAFNLGPFNYTYVGWAQIPVGNILAEREKKTDRVAVLSK